MRKSLSWGNISGNIRKGFVSRVARLMRKSVIRILVLKCLVVVLLLSEVFLGQININHNFSESFIHRSAKLVLTRAELSFVSS